MSEDPPETDLAMHRLHCTQMAAALVAASFNRDTLATASLTIELENPSELLLGYGVIVEDLAIQLGEALGITPGQVLARTAVKAQYAMTLRRAHPSAGGSADA